jgi:hypothetical protein
LVKRERVNVYPRFPKTFWDMDYILGITGKGAVQLPLGLITVAGVSNQVNCSSWT